MLTSAVVDTGVLAVMILCGLVPLVVLCRIKMLGWNKAALLLVALVIGALIAAVYSAVTPSGIDPLRALVTGQIVLGPASLGSVAGLALGWFILYRRKKRSGVGRK